MLFLFIHTLLAQQISGPIQIHATQRYFTTTEGQPFFWLADTSWELFHRLDLEESKICLDKRASQGFNVVRAVALTEPDGLNDPNVNGDKPFLDDQYYKPNEVCWKNMDLVLDLNLGNLAGNSLLGTWYDPRIGVKFPVGKMSKIRKSTVIPSSQGRGDDWILILESVD